jgi:purine-nucleoside phosphorylase
MAPDNAIVYPIKDKNAQNPGPVAVMVGSQPDLLFLCNLFKIKKENSIGLFMSRLYCGDGCFAGISLIGPFIGAPYATILLENMIVRGVKKIIFFGWCGAVSRNAQIGDIILPTGSAIDEGTSRHYKIESTPEDSRSSLHGKYGECWAKPSTHILERTRKALIECELEFHEGLVWSTDAVYRETPDKVEYFRKKGVLAVEMELSALFSVGTFRDVEVGGLLVVSDEIATSNWRRGFSDKRFKKSRKAAAKVIERLCKTV